MQSNLVRFIVSAVGAGTLSIVAACGSGGLQKQDVLDYLHEIEAPGDQACIADFIIEAGISADDFESAKQWDGDGTPPSAVNTYRQGRDQCGGSTEERLDEIEAAVEDAGTDSSTEPDSFDPESLLAITNACSFADIAARGLDLDLPLTSDDVEQITEDLADISDEAASDLIGAIADSRGADQEAAVRSFAVWCEDRP